MGSDARVHEGCEGDRSVDGDAVLEVGDDAEVAAWESNLIHGNGHVQGAQQRILGVFQDRSSVGISKRDGAHTGQERYRRNGTDVEAAEVVLATHVGALEWRRH